MVYSGGDGSIIGLISHISSRNGGELLMNLITRYKTVRKSFLDKTNHVTQPAGHAGAVKKNLILSHQKNPVISNFHVAITRCRKGVLGLPCSGEGRGELQLGMGVRGWGGRGCGWRHCGRHQACRVVGSGGGHSPLHHLAPALRPGVVAQGRRGRKKGGSDQEQDRKGNQRGF